MDGDAENEGFRVFGAHVHAGWMRASSHHRSLFLYVELAMPDHDAAAGRSFSQLANPPCRRQGEQLAAQVADQPRDDRQEQRPQARAAVATPSTYPPGPIKRRISGWLLVWHRVCRRRGGALTPAASVACAPPLRIDPPQVGAEGSQRAEGSALHERGILRVQVRHGGQVVKPIGMVPIAMMVGRPAQGNRLLQTRKRP